MAWNDDLQFDLDLNQDLLNTQLFSQNLQSTLDATQNRLNTWLMFKNNLGNPKGVLSGVAGGPLGWAALAAKAVGDNVKAAQSQFDLTGFNNQLNNATTDFLHTAGQANTTSDLLGLNSQIPDFTEDINNQGYKWDGNLLSGIGAIIGNANTERDKQKARGAQIAAQDRMSSGILGAQNRVSNIQYRQGMANYLNNAALGGPLSTHGADFTDGLIYINTGGTHEQNPFGGVPAGVDPQGIPNLVEEGETIWDDYVFSDRLKTPKEFLNKYKLGGSKKKGSARPSFSDTSKEVIKKVGVDLRPNDPISKRTRDAILSELEDTQEEVRMKKEQRDFIKALSEMSPEEFAAMMQPQQQMVQPETIPVESNIPPQGMNEEYSGIDSLMPQEEQGLGVPGGYALGGNLFYGGGHAKRIKEQERIANSIRNGSLKWDPNIKRWVGQTGTVGEGIKQYSDEYLTNLFGEDQYRDILSTVRSQGSLEQSLPGEEYDINGVGRFLPGDYASYYGRIHAPGYTGTPGWSVLAPGVPASEAVQETQPTKDTGRKSSGRGSGRIKGSTPTLPDAGLTAAELDAIINQPVPEIEATEPINLKNDTFVINKIAQNNNSDDNLYPTWMRYAPIIGGGLSVLSDAFSQPDYSGYESALADARRLSRPVNIPVQTIGNRLRRNPFDERLAVNQANQNLAAGLRSTMDTAGGNRAYRQFANNMMAYNNQGQLFDVGRNAYLANRQDALQTADFNRYTDMFNTQAINQRNLTQAQLNSNREMSGFSARLNALQGLENAKRYDDQLASADMTAFLTSLGNLGYENTNLNTLNALAREGLYNITRRRNGDLEFVPSTSSACGGKIKTKKRRF